jgi:mycofactocin system glycosyltransferase
MTLPRGFRVTLEPDTLLLNDAAVLLGGSPLVAFRLGPSVRHIVRQRGLTITDPQTAVVADRLLATNLALPDLDETPDARPGELTVVIPVRDRPEQLERCLASLGGLACFVVDDDSFHSESVREVAERHGATYLRLHRNVGPAGARNVGLAATCTPYVAFVDSDVQVRAEALLRLARHFADPSVALVGPRVVGHSRASRPRWFDRYETRASSLTLGKRGGVVRPGAAVAWLPSACLVARVEPLGVGFDDRLRVGEDVDLVWRLADGGHRVRYDADVEARHDTRGSVREWLGRKAVYGTGSATLATRHGEYVAPAVLSPAYALAAAAILARRRWAIPLVAWALVRGHRAIRRSLPEDCAAGPIATKVAVRGLGWAIRQQSALLLRHWWPATAVGVLMSANARRALATALFIDVAVVLRELDDLPRRDLAAHLAARRLDDLAYGAGLWFGALRARSARALLPRWVVRRPD